MLFSGFLQNEQKIEQGDHLIGMIPEEFKPKNRVVAPCIIWNKPHAGETIVINALTREIKTFYAEWLPDSRYFNAFWTTH